MGMTIRDGTSQQDRGLPALQPGYFRPDEMGLPELLFLGQRIAQQLRYVGPAGAEGDWQPLFLGDESALLGGILVEARKLAALRGSLHGFVDRIQALLLGAAPCPLPQDVPAYRIAVRIRDWWLWCGQNGGAEAGRLHQLLDGLRKTALAPALDGLTTFMARHDRDRTVLLRQRLGADWCHGGGTVPARDARPDEVAHFLRENFLTFASALAVVRKAVETAFPESVRSGAHDPAAGLYLAFANLFLKAKGGIDDFSQRYQDFYYERVLGFAPRPMVPDRADLVLAPDGVAQDVMVAKGAMFVARAGDGSETLYAAEDELRVCNVRVAALHTLFFDRDPNRSPERDLGFATAATTSTIPVTPGKRYFSLFGAARRLGGGTAGLPARLGFAVSSPVLRLEDGSRDVRIALYFQAGRYNLDALVKKICELAPGMSPEGAFFRAFAKMFRVRVTVPEGWAEVPEFIPSSSIVSGEIPPDCLEIAFKLPETFPPVVDYRQEVHGENFAADCPVLSFTIEPDAYLFPYEFLVGLTVFEALITVDVSGSRKLTLYNNHGALNATSPFVPFGPLPKVGSHLIVGSREAFAKNLTRLGLRIKWDDLPPEGLARHYRGYGAGIEAASFRATLSSLDEHGWQPAKPGERIEIPLWGQVDAHGAARYDCARVLPYLHPSEEGGEYGPHARGGFLKLTLAAPAQAFGHASYPLLLAQAFTRNAQREALGPLRRLLGRWAAAEMPEPPYTPLVSAISLDYTAQASISLRQGGVAASWDLLHHLHPFGVDTLKLYARGETRLLPVAPHDASLFIGLAAAELGGPLSLHFHLRPDSDMNIDAPRPSFRWYHLQRNRWIPLEGFRVLSDSTRGFLTSGTVKLDLPRDMDKGNTVMDDGLFWLRLGADGPVASLCSLHAVHVNGVRVARVQGSGAAAPGPLPAGSIQAAKVTIPGVAAILQPEASFGGLPQEERAAMAIRAGERLKHRQRAVTAWDYERLVLQQFPHLHKVKCFINTCFSVDPAQWHRPGHVLVAVIPRCPEGSDSSDHLKENVLVLQDIKDYLAPLASPFVQIDVRNPVIERVQVRCAVRFRNGGAQGLLIKQFNRDIGEFIAPGGVAGNSASFGWSLRCQELQGYLQGLSYVDSVWGLSLLRVVEDGQERFSLHDTAREAKHGPMNTGPLYPWSIVLPFRHHLVDVERDAADGPGPWKSGISQLQVGATFIVSRKHHGEKE